MRLTLLQTSCKNVAFFYLSNSKKQISGFEEGWKKHRVRYLPTFQPSTEAESDIIPTEIRYLTHASVHRGATYRFAVLPQHSPDVELGVQF